MPSLKFPDTGTRLVLRTNGKPAVGDTGYLYEDEDLTAVAEAYADVNGTKGALLPTDADGRRYITLDAYGRQVDYWGPEAGRDRLWLVVNGVKNPVDADYKAQIDAVAAAVAAIETGGADDSAVVHKAGAETITGVKTFSSSPVVPTPIDVTDAANKAYADTKQSADADLTAIAALTAADNDVVQRKSGAWANRTPAQFKTDLGLAKADVGLGNVDNTSDANKPISNATSEALGDKVGKGAVVINVRDFAATGNGTTNDTIAVQAAITAAVANGGGTVWFPAGTYRCNIVLPSKVVLRGSGVGATVLMAVAGSNTDVVRGTNFSALTGKTYVNTDISAGSFLWEIHDLTINGDKASQTSGYGIRTFGRSWTVTNAVVRNCKSGGMWTEFTTHPDGSYDSLLEARVDGLKIHGCDGHGWTHRGPHDTYAHDIIFVGNTGWAFRGEGVTGSYNGGISGSNWNSWLNTEGSFYFGRPSHMENIIASGATGVGIELAAGVGACKLLGVNLGSHPVGAIVRGTNHLLEFIATNTAVAVRMGDATGSVGMVELSLTGSAVGTAVEFDTLASGVTVSGIVACTTLYTGTAPSTSMITLRQQGGAGNQLVQFPGTGFTARGYTPTWPQSNGKIVTTDEALTLSGKTMAGLKLSLTTRTSAYTMGVGDTVATADATTAPFTITLPDATLHLSRIYTIKRVNAGANAVTVGTTSGQTIDGMPSYILSMPQSSVDVISDGVNWRVVGSMLKGDPLVLDIRLLGAVGDGLDVGSTAATNTSIIQSAMDTVSAAGGGVVLIPPGTFVIKPATSGALRVFAVPSNVTFRGYGPSSTLKISSSAGDYGQLFGNLGNVTNVAFDNFRIDQNPTGNTGCDILTGGTNSNGNTNYQQFAIHMWACTNLTVDNMFFDSCCGVNTVTAGGTATSAAVRDSRFNFVKGNSTATGVFGPGAYDNSCIYLEIDQQTITGNTFESPSIAQYATGAVESHGGRSSITGNTCKNFLTFLNIVPRANGISPELVPNNIAAVGNTATNVRQGIQLWGITGRTLRNVTIVGNTISVANVDRTGESTNHSFSGISTVYSTSGTLNGAFDNLVIADNVIGFQIESGTDYGDESYVAAGVGLVTQGNVTNAKVTGNIVTNAPKTGIALKAFSPATHERVRIVDNQIVDSGRVVSAAGGPGQINEYRAGIYLSGVLKYVDVVDNRVIDTNTGATPNGHFGVTCVPRTTAADFTDVTLENNRCTTYGSGSLPLAPGYVLDNVTWVTSDKWLPFSISSGTFTPRPEWAARQELTVTSATAITIAAPTIAVKGMRLAIMVTNSSGGQLGTVTWNATYKLAGSWVSPETGKSLTITFVYNGAGWVEESRSANIPAAGAAQPVVAVGQYLHDAGLTAVTTATLSAGSDGVLWLLPVDVPASWAFDRAGIRITTAGVVNTTTPTGRFGLYADDGTLSKPANAAPLADWGTVNLTAAGDVYVTMAWTPPAAGRYWIGCLAQGLTGLTTQPVATFVAGASPLAYAATDLVVGWSMSGLGAAVAMPTLSGLITRSLAVNAPIAIALRRSA